MKRILKKVIPLILCLSVLVFSFVVPASATITGISGNTYLFSGSLAGGSWSVAAGAFQMMGTQTDVLGTVKTQGSDTVYDFYSVYFGYDLDDAAANYIVFKCNAPIVTDIVVNRLMTFEVSFTSLAYDSDGFVANFVESYGTLVSTSSYHIGSGQYSVVRDTPIDLVDPSWIGTENTLFYDVGVDQIEVVTPNLVRTFDQLNISLLAYIDNNNYSIGFGVNDESGLENSTTLFLLVKSSGAYSIQYTQDAYYGSTSYIRTLSEFACDENFYNLFNALFTIYEGDSNPVDPLPPAPDYPDFDGNPFVVIFEGVIEALSVPLWGDISIWNIFTAILGATVVIWLLKLLAGG